MREAWTHLCLTVDRAGLHTLYLDGEPRGCRSGNALIPGARRFLRIGAEILGGGTTNGSHFRGRMDEVMIFHAALTPMEVQLLARKSAPDRVKAGKLKPISTRPDPGRLLLHLGFDKVDAAGNPLDSGPGRVRVLRQGNAKPVPGVVGQAMAFDGTSDYVAVDPIALPNSFTVAGWMRVNELGPWRTMLKTCDGLTDNVVQFGSGAGRMNANFTTSASGGKTLCSLYSPEAMQAGEWMHMAVTVAADGRAVFYQNGKPQGFLQSHFEPVAPGKRRFFNVGGSADNQGRNNRPLNGVLDEVMVFAGELSAAEIATLARKP